MRRLFIAVLAAAALVLGLVAPTEAAVARKVKLTGPSAPSVGALFALNGKVTKSPKRTKVAIYKKVGSSTHWTKVRTVKTRNKRGDFIFKTRLYSTTTVRYQARVAKQRKLRKATSRTVTVTPKVLWTKKWIGGGGGYNDELIWKPYDGSAAPGFELESGTGTRGYGYEANFGDLAAGASAYITFDLQGKCSTGTLNLRRFDDLADAVTHISAEADGRELTSLDLGANVERARDIDVTGTSKLTIRATVTQKPSPSWRAPDFWIVGDSFLTCWSTLKTN